MVICCCMCLICFGRCCVIGFVVGLELGWCLFGNLWKCMVVGLLWYLMVREGGL